MSLDDATTLRVLLDQGRIEPQRALMIMREVVVALGELHGARKTHGNVSPGTIFVAARHGKDEIELRDAGAKGAKDPAYNAPGLADARADLYAAGAVLFELLAGRPPFAADDADGLRRLHAYAPRQTLKQRDPDGSFLDEVEAVVATALAQQRDARFKDAKSMIEAIDRALAAVATTAPNESSPAPKPSSGAAPPPLDPSLLLLAQDLMPPQETRASEPVIADNVGREVPKIPWHTQARLHIRRSTRNQKIGVIVGSVIFFVILVAMCGGSSKKPDANAGKAAKPEHHQAADDLEADCAVLAHECGDNDKHIRKILDDCTTAIAKVQAHHCVKQSHAAYECFEAKLCSSKKIWALEDIRVLSKRNKQCVAELAALDACSK